MKRVLTPAQRLIVAADFKAAPGQDEQWIRIQTLTLVEQLAGTGVFIKLNTAARACGYRLARELQEMGVEVFEDWKVCDVDETLSNDAALLWSLRPRLMSCMPDCGHVSMERLHRELPPETFLLAITVLTHLTEKDAAKLYRCTIPEAVLSRAHMAREAGLTGLVCAPKELEVIQDEFEDWFEIVTPDVRFADVEVRGETQNLKRAMAPDEAIHAGASQIVMGRPITQATNPRDVAQKAIDLIASAL